ncbi:hypothetical protein VMCG_00956 [Cytospora schulzeri]|uniref:Uncharacterized protein n=1 Tax=Cytospora schulzeri TaxID=448051 RepID=A0A423X591_9PEZI|nr:hypothetical protein VMCG_00956 [Valsa malicola]
MPAQSITLATHGIEAIQDSSTTFKITFNHGAADITVLPTSSSTKGWLHWIIPSPPPGYTILKESLANFSVTDGVTVTGIQTYQGATQLLHYITTTDSGKVQSKTAYPFAATQYDGNGIVLSLQVEFTSLPATLSVVSAGVVAYSE